MLALLAAFPRLHGVRDVPSLLFSYAMFMRRMKEQGRRNSVELPASSFRSPQRPTYPTIP